MAKSIDGQQVYEAVEAYGDGVSAARLIEDIVWNGYEEQQVCRKIREALDRGWIKTGQGLLLYPGQPPVSGITERVNP